MVRTRYRTEPFFRSPPNHLTKHQENLFNSNYRNLALFCLLSVFLATCANRNLTTPRPSVSTDGAIKSSPILDREARLRRAVIATAEEYLGTKYCYAGRSRKSGFDCSNFTGYVLEQHGIRVSAGSRNQELQGRKISESEARRGDLVFFRRSKTGPVFHVALVVDRQADRLEVIHSTSSRGVVKDEILSNSWWKTKFRTYRNVISDPSLTQN